MLPFLLVFFTFTVWPVVMSMGLSFTTYNVFEAPRFLGFENYVKLFFNDSVFLTAMQNTFLLSIIVGPLSYLLSLFLAWMVNEFRNPWRTILTVVFYAPTLSNAVFTIWLIVFDGDIYGYLNSILLKMGLISDPIQWTRDPKYMMMVVIIVQLWVSLGTSFLTLRAGFNTVDRQYYEAEPGRHQKPVSGAVVHHPAHDGAAPDAQRRVGHHRHLHHRQRGHRHDRVPLGQLCHPYHHASPAGLQHHPV